MASLHFELVSPARLLFSGDVDSVVVPATEGEMGILAGHAPVLTTLKPGVVTVNKSGSGAERIFVRGGFAEVNPAGLTVLAEVAIPMAELNPSALAQQIKNAEEDLADAKGEEARRLAAENLEHLKSLQAAI